MIKLTSLADWRKILNQSCQQPIIIFKHSNRCPFSAQSYQLLQKAEMTGQLNTPIQLIIVQQAKMVSDQIATDLGVKHESPQVIIVRNKKAIYTADHQAIKPESLIATLYQSDA